MNEPAVIAFALLAIGGGCGRATERGGAPAASAPRTVPDARVPAQSPSPDAAAIGVQEEPPVEPAEAKPGSQMVKLKLEVYPRSARAMVTWGAKKLGPPPIELERPRASGPIDLVVKADGFLDHHTRLFTDRDDRLSVSLRSVRNGPPAPVGSPNDDPPSIGVPAPTP